MQFPHSSQLSLPCQFERIVEGALHPDGRRYLPLLIFGLPHTIPDQITQLGVVDRHHRADPALVGRRGIVRLVFLLSTLQISETPVSGLFDPAADTGRATTMPTACGQVIAVPTWETGSGYLPYETLYTEILLDIGIGIIGVRTSTTAVNLNNQLGKQRIEPGDWITATRSRIDILEFQPHD